MDLYLDTVKLEEIRQATDWGLLRGVTTNPSLFAQAGHVRAEPAVKAICQIIDGPVSLQCTATDTDGMVEQGRRWASWAPNVMVKCPCSRQGLIAARRLVKEGIRVNITMVFSPAQALLGAAVGAWCVSQFAGRIDDYADDSMDIVRMEAEIFRIQGIKTRILVAAVRHPLHVTRAAHAGAHIATMRFGLMEQLIDHPLTDVALAKTPPPDVEF